MSDFIELNVNLKLPVPREMLDLEPDEEPSEEYIKLWERAYTHLLLTFWNGFVNDEELPESEDVARKAIEAAEFEGIAERFET